MNRIWRRQNRGFTLIELLVVLVVGGIMTTGLYSFLQRQRKQITSQKLRADVESMAQIAFFIIGRDIRRAGSNPLGWDKYAAGEAIAFESPTENRLIIRADLDGDGVVTTGTDERVIYEFIDDPDNPDGVPDQIRRQAGNQLVIQNVREFALCYWMVGGFWNCNPPDGQEATIRKVRLRLVAGTGRINPNSGEEDTKEIIMNIRPRNFDL